MSTPKNYLLKVWRGNTFKQDLIFYDVEDGVKTPTDLTGSDYILKIVLSDEDATEVVKTIGDGITVDDPLTGKISLLLTANETRLIPLGISSYELEKHINGEEYTVLYGSLSASGGANDDN